MDSDTFCKNQVNQWPGIVFYSDGTGDLKELDKVVEEFIWKESKGDE